MSRRLIENFVGVYDCVNAACIATEAWDEKVIITIASFARQIADTRKDGRHWTFTAFPCEFLLVEWMTVLEPNPGQYGQIQILVENRIVSMNNSLNENFNVRHWRWYNGIQFLRGQLVFVKNYSTWRNNCLSLPLNNVFYQKRRKIMKKTGTSFYLNAFVNISAVAYRSYPASDMRKRMF